MKKCAMQEEPIVHAETDHFFTELLDVELALIGGGIGDVILG